MTSENATQRLCERITAIGFDDFDDNVIACARQLFLDGIAVALAGAVLEEPPALLAEQAKLYGGAEQASVIGLGFKASLYQAALINGAAMHVMDFEAMWLPVNHQLSTCLPAILALAEHRELPGREVAAALIKGVEMMGRIRQASKQFDIRLPLFHLPGATGPMGATVAVAHLLNLPGETLQRAFGIVGSRCAGLWPNNGTHTKSTHCGLSSANGLDAAMLAERGFTGNPTVFEASRGYVAAFFDEDDFDWDHLLSYGDPYKVIEPGYAIKMFPSQYVTHFVIAGTQDLRNKIGAAAGNPDQIEELIVHGPRVDYIDRPFPESGLAGKFSYQYAAACTWLDGTVSMESYTDARRFAPDMEAMLKRTRLNPRPDISAVLGERYVEIEAKLKDGRSEIVRCDGPPGCFGKPKIPPEKHLEKVRDCLHVKLPPTQAEHIIEYGSRLETLTGAEIKELMEILRAD